MQREKIILFRAGSEEKKLIEQLAKGHAQTTSEFIRALIQSYSTRINTESKELNSTFKLEEGMPLNSHLVKKPVARG